MITVISRFRVRNGLEEEVRKAFLERPRLVESEHGFFGLEVLTDASDPSVFLLLTRWNSDAAFRAWHGSEAHHRSHDMIPGGLKLDASFTQLIVGTRIEDPGGVSNFNDAMEGRTVSLSRWLVESDAVFALILSPDGTIRVRNRAANRIFARAKDHPSGTAIWDYLQCSDAESLRRQISAETRTESHFLLNLDTGEQTSVEAGVIDCGSGFLLLGAIEQRHAQRLHREMQQLANDMSVMTRELGRKNKELEEAKRTIERIARTDALTGLANRRTFDDAFGAEISRATRQGKPLTLIMADLDHFKSINDKLGHVVGDQVLAMTGTVFATRVRPYDLAARYGGEEFAVLLPGTGLEEGLTIAERLRKRIAEIEIPKVPRRITISVGVAALASSESANELIARADAALYRAKRGGRNRTETDPPSIGQPEKRDL